MSDLRQLRELVDQFPPPDFDDLAGISTRRRRRTGMAALAGLTAGTLVIALAVGLSGRPRAADPVDGPTDPSPSPAAEDWSPERIRAEGTSSRFSSADPSGIAARWWTVCTATDCEDDTGNSTGDEQTFTALELTLNGYRTSSLHDINRGDHPTTTYIEVFDHDTFFVRDAAEPGSTQSRFRLLDADGPAVTLTRLGGVASAAPGPDVVAPFAADLYRVDAESATIQALDVPPEVDMWARDTAHLLWGIGGNCVVYWQQADGTFGRRSVDCRANLSIVEGLPDRVMAVEDNNRQGIPVAVHVSLDGGASWQRVRPDHLMDMLPGQ